MTKGWQVYAREVCGSMANDQVGKRQTCHPPKLNEYESKNELYANLKSGQKKVRLRLRGS